MPEYTFLQLQALGLNGSLITPADTFRGLDFAVGTVLSGGGYSGSIGSLNLKPVSGPERLRLYNLDLHQLDVTTWLLVELRDGNISGGGLIAGPWIVPPASERHIGPEELAGRYAVSSIAVHVVSGGAANPLSTGLRTKVSYFVERLDLPEERQV